MQKNDAAATACIAFEQSCGDGDNESIFPYLLSLLYLILVEYLCQVHFSNGAETNQAEDENLVATNRPMTAASDCICHPTKLSALNI